MSKEARKARYPEVVTGGIKHLVWGFGEWNSSLVGVVCALDYCAVFSLRVCSPDMPSLESSIMQDPPVPAYLIVGSTSALI